MCKNMLNVIKHNECSIVFKLQGSFFVNMYKQVYQAQLFSA